MTDDTAKKLTVRTLFKPGESYRIPEYQRNYAWTGTEIRQLIEDVRLAHTSHRPQYFLGNIVTTRTEDGAYEVVDGQQRLTTLVLLLSALRLSLENPVEVFAVSPQVLTFASRTKATTALKRVATSTTHDAALEALGGSVRNAEDADPAGSTPQGAVQGMHAGYSVMRAELTGEHFGTEADREAFCGYLLNHVEVIRVDLPLGTDLNRYFEVMNTRGVQLDPADIVRSQLMSALTGDDAELRTFQRIWDACAQMEGFVQIALTPGDPGLRNALFGPNWQWLAVTSFEELTEHLSGSAANGHAGSRGPRDLVTALEEYQENRASDADDEDGPQNRQYQPTVRFPFLLLHALALFEAQESWQADASHSSGAEGHGRATSSQYAVDDPALDDKQLIKAFSTAFPKVLGEVVSTADPDQVRRFALHLLRVRNLFDAYIVRRHQPGPSTGDDDSAWVLKSLAAQGPGRKRKATYLDTFGKQAGSDEAGGDQPASGSRSDQRDLVLLESMLRVTYTSPRSMRWITDVLRTALKHHFPAAGYAPGSAAATTAAIPPWDLRNLLHDIARARIRAGFWRGDDSQPIDLDISDPEALLTGFDIPRIVFTYLDYLLLDEHFGKDPSAKGRFKPVDSAAFVFRFRNSVEHFSPSTRDVETDNEIVTENWKQSLGNLALITVRQNSKFSNSSPKTKSESSDTVLRQSPKLWRMAYLTQSTGKWNDSEIQNHHEECLEILRQDLFSEAGE